MKDHGYQIHLILSAILRLSDSAFHQTRTQIMDSRSPYLADPRSYKLYITGPKRQAQSALFTLNRAYTNHTKHNSHKRSSKQELCSPYQPRNHFPSQAKITNHLPPPPSPAYLPVSPSAPPLSPPLDSVSGSFHYPACPSHCHSSPYSPRYPAARVRAQVFCLWASSSAGQGP